MARLGVKTPILTNAAGGVNTAYGAGALTLIADHINYSGINSLIGPNPPEFGLRFPDMTDVYTRKLREKLKPLAAAGALPQTLDHSEVVETASRVKADFARLLEIMIDAA